jgi:hypothetical protein
MAGLAGGNLLRVLDKAEAVALELRNERPNDEIYDKRPDLPMRWGEL